MIFKIISSIVICIVLVVEFLFIIRLRKISARHGRLMLMMYTILKDILLGTRKETTTETGSNDNEK